ncbi:MAG: PAS domain S-box protein [Bacteroidetes bacterium]|nr:PAS domain S-box protein [Bacteroidota bacterium]
MKTLVIRDESYSNQILVEDFIKFNNNVISDCINIKLVKEINDIQNLNNINSIVYFASRKSNKEISELFSCFNETESNVIIIFEEPQKIPAKYSGSSNLEFIYSKDFNAASLSAFFNYFLKLNNNTNLLNRTLRTEYNFNLDEIFDNKLVGVTLSDLDGNIIKCNNAFSEMVKFTKDEICKMNFSEFTYADDLIKGKKKFDEIINNKTDHFSIDLRYISKEGKIVWGDLTATLINDKKNNKQYTLGLVVDITSKKEIEDRLKVEKDFSITLLDNSPDSIYFKDLSSKFIKVNKSVLNKFNKKDEAEMIGKSDFDLFKFEHAQKAYVDEQKIIQTGQPLIGVEEKETWLDSSITYASTTKLPLKDINGNIIGTYGITRDITKQKEAEINLAKEKKRADLIYKLIPSAIFTVDNNKFITSWNKRAEEITGFKKDEVLNKHCSIFAAHPCDISCAIFEDSINKPVFGNKCFIKNKDGRIISILKNMDYLKNENGDIIGGIESFDDLTERNEYEKVQDAQAQISEAVHSTPDISTLYKIIHNVVRQLMPAENFYIALFDEITETISFPYFVDEFDAPPAPRKLRKGLTEYVLRTGKDVLVDQKMDALLKAQGEVELIGEMQSIWLGIPLKISDKVIGVMAVQDYTNEKVYGEKERQILMFVSEQIAFAIDKKRSQHELEKYSEELKQLNITKDKFFSIIAHDLKNPFITLLGFSDMLVHDYDELTDEEVLTYITDIRNSAKLSHELLENLLDWSRSQTGKIEYEPHQFDIHELVKRNVLLLYPMAKTKKVELICEVIPGTGVYADYEMINTVLRNLISNAVKFTNKEGRIRVYSENIDGYLKLNVEDNGVGMDEKTLNKLFMLGEQHTTKGTAKESGTGLGLILCKEFVEKNHGQISADSIIGKGTTFWFTVPTNENHN